MHASPRQLVVAPDRFDIVSDDVVLIADLSSALAVCIYDAVEEAGALLHLRIIVRNGHYPADVTDSTLATELLLLDRCVESLREAAPASRNLQAKIVVHRVEDERAQLALEAMLMLVKDFLTDAGVRVALSDISAGEARELRFRPSMGWLQIR